MKNTHSAVRARLCPAAIGLCIAFPALGQQAAAPASTPDSAQLEEIVVTGLRETQRSSIEFKRDSSGHRRWHRQRRDRRAAGQFRGRYARTHHRRRGRSLQGQCQRAVGARSRPGTEFLDVQRARGEHRGPGSIRWRSSSSRPSCVNGVLVYKSQQADFAEGGIAGVVELRSLKPIEFGKRRFQSEVRAVYLPKDADIDGRDGIGDRANISYIDSFDTADRRSWA